ncbi:MAG TPA: peptidase S10 [Thermoanaerobaculia bacterium]|jgi:carboxypeptidase C (cathepsin A)|nr:peptidase S10 [Thermoanaerobaculia bacterium]
MPRTSRLPILLALLLSFSFLPHPIRADEPPAKPPAADKADKAKPGADKEAKPVQDKVSRTQHSITLGGQKIAYTATAGTLVLADEDGKPRASFFYIAYTRDGVKDPRERPVTFSYNGGPGSAALWVNIGAFGPRRVEMSAEGMPLPPPARLVDNEDSLLDVTDLVFVDPIGTGYSRPAPGEPVKDFTGLKNDIESMGAFIRLWINRNQRWGSPKFLAGESYGTTRSAGLAAHLQDRYGLDLNGIVLVSAVLNWQDFLFGPGNDMPYITYLPTYAAAAWYHKKLPPELSGDLRKTLDEVQEFALHDYAIALLEGNRMPATKRHEIAVKVARYTGLSVDYVERADLRIEHEHFAKELLRDQGKTIGRLDSRFTGRDRDGVGEVDEFDPADTAVDAPFVAAMSDYVRRDLGFETDLIYERSSEKVYPWALPEGQYVAVAEPLRKAMMKNPSLKVMIASGYFDMATPFFDGTYTIAHMGLPESDRGRMHQTFYEAGHMMYIHPPDHAKLHKDIAEFMRSAIPGK